VLERTSAIADIEMRWVLRQQCGGLLTAAASSSQTAASCISEFTLPTLSGRPKDLLWYDRFQRITAARFCSSEATILHA
jgi:hypothetical protein